MKPCSCLCDNQEVSSCSLQSPLSFEILNFVLIHTRSLSSCFMRFLFSCFWRTRSFNYSVLCYEVVFLAKVMGHQEVSNCWQLGCVILSLSMLLMDWSSTLQILTPALWDLVFNFCSHAPGIFQLPILRDDISFLYVFLIIWWWP